MEYLGHKVTKSGVEPLEEKIQAIQQGPLPRSVKALRGFLGLLGFFRCFIKGYGIIVAPLT